MLFRSTCWCRRCRGLWQELIAEWIVRLGELEQPPITMNHFSLTFKFRIYIGEMILQKGKVKVAGTVAYCDLRPWILNTTVKVR